MSTEDYESDVDRIVNAFATDSADQREKLLSALRTTKFLATTNGASGAKLFSAPDETYLATERLQSLFSGIAVQIVDDAYPCLRGEDVRELLEAAGAVRYLRPIADSSLGWNERQRLRAEAGHEETSYQKDRIVDWTLAGLPDVLSSLSNLGEEDRRARARILWEELAHLEERRGKGVFTGEYTWSHYGTYRAAFDAAFVRMLNEADWIPDGSGNLQRPEFVLFDTLGWEPYPFLLSKIRFKPPIIDQLAHEAGIEPGVLDLLRKLGLTSEAELRERLGVEEKASSEDENVDNVDETKKKLPTDLPGPTPPIPGPTVQSGVGNGADASRGQSGPTGSSGGSTGGGYHDSADGVGPGAGQRQPNSERHGTAGGTGRTFISYVATRPDDVEPDPDGLDQAARMRLEAKAIDFILVREPNWQRTPTHNPGYDLYQTDDRGALVQWCEVKAMTSTLRDRPVGLSHTQFECARTYGPAYWLYVVENTDGDEARLVRIQDPAGKARTFTFDRGWLEVADLDREQPI